MLCFGDSDYEVLLSMRVYAHALFGRPMVDQRMCIDKQTSFLRVYWLIHTFIRSSVGKAVFSFLWDMNRKND